MRSSNETITSRIPRIELVGLLDTMTPWEQQRVTAEIKAVDEADLEAAEIVSPIPLQDAAQEVQSTAPATTSQLDLVVRFVSHAGTPLTVTPPPSATTTTEPRLPSWAIVAGSCVVTLMLGCLTMAAA